jgi:hypothetical protein
MSHDDEYFGSPAKIALMKRSRDLWSLLRDNPRFAYYGRMVALSGPGDDTVALMCALARLQGATICYYCPSDSAAGLFAELESLGLSTDRHEQFWGGEGAYLASQTVEKTTPLPDDLTIVVIDPDTPRKTVAEIAELSQSCDVMPVPGPVMRGQICPGVCLAAVDREGRAVATASSYSPHHSSSPLAKDVFWGMLATRKDRRGERIGLLLGAKAIIHMWERHGARGFRTGVRADNRPSQALCSRLGVQPTNWIYAACIDTEVLGDSSITK